MTDWRLSAACLGADRDLFFPRDEQRSRRQNVKSAGQLSMPVNPAIRSYKYSNEQRFDARYDQDGECWRWRAGINSSGYGAFYWTGHKGYAHRYSYERFNGPLVEGMNIDHLCGNRWCVNPSHLQQVTPAENTRRALKPLHGPLAPTTCRNGHVWDDETAYKVKRRDGRVTRTCRQCALANVRRNYPKYEAKRQERLAALRQTTAERKAATAASNARAMRERRAAS